MRRELVATEESMYELGVTQQPQRQLAVEPSSPEIVKGSSARHKAGQVDLCRQSGELDMACPSNDQLLQLETTCGSLLYELQVFSNSPLTIIWDEVGESDTERDKMLLELEQECLEVYRRKVDQANRCRAQLRRAIADSEAELAAICSAMGEPPVHTRQDENRYNAGRGAHLSLKRAEKARALVNKIPDQIFVFLDNNISIIQDQKRLQGQLIAEQEALYGSKPSPSKSQSAKKIPRTSAGCPSRRLSGATQPLKLDQLHSAKPVRSAKKTDDLGILSPG
ncbi:hypothetical protein BHE74_00039075 [Ensete ventricosum]|nr:hypothetical protein BHE74_00039075 [Ensete ventricosum]